MGQYWQNSVTVENLNILSIVRVSMLSFKLILNEYISIIYKSIEILQYFR